MRKCNNCGKEYDETVKGAIKKYCSKKCGRQDYYQKNSKKERKANAHWYQEHRESELAKNKEYRDQNRELFHWYHNKKRFNGMREVVLDRDNNECQGCFSKDNLHIHHKDGTGETSAKTSDIKINNDLNNLICLCRKCHMFIHGWQRRNGKILIENEEIIRVINQNK